MKLIIFRSLNEHLILMKIRDLLSSLNINLSSSRQKSTHKSKEWTNTSQIMRNLQKCLLIIWNENWKILEYHLIRWLKLMKEANYWQIRKTETKWSIEKRRWCWNFWTEISPENSLFKMWLIFKKIGPLWRKPHQSWKRWTILKIRRLKLTNHS